jgi:hypothetical protein
VVRGAGAPARVVMCICVCVCVLGLLARLCCSRLQGGGGGTIIQALFVSLLQVMQAASPVLLRPGLFLPAVAAFALCRCHPALLLGAVSHAIK